MPEEYALMTFEDARNLVAAVIEEYGGRERQGDYYRNQPGILEAGNDLTLSFYSELQYGLRIRKVDGSVAQQQLPAEVTSSGYLEFPQHPPSWARDVVVVHTAGLPDEHHKLPYKGPIRLSHPKEALAVKLRDGMAAVRLVSFVTFVDRGIPKGNSAIRKATPPTYAGQSKR